MPTQKKMETVEQITELLSKNKYIIVTDYRGLTVAEIQDLRKQLRTIDTKYQVVKNNLAKFAAENSGNSAISELLVGPTAIAFGQGDPSKMAKMLMDYTKATKSELKIKGSFINGRLLTAQETSQLATLPSIDILRTQLLGILQSPLLRMQRVLSANIHSLYRVLNGRIRQLEGTSDAS